VEAIRAVLLAEEKLYAATLASLVAYQGLRVPEEGVSAGVYAETAVQTVGPAGRRMLPPCGRS
jgi:hypothetical protein